LALVKGTDRFLVQCKHWRRSSVGVAVIREFYGVMTARAVAGGFVVTSGSFTPDAWGFAAQCGVELIDGERLEAWISQTRTGVRPSPCACCRGAQFDRNIDTCVSAVWCRYGLEDRATGPICGATLLGVLTIPAVSWNAAGRVGDRNNRTRRCESLFGGLRAPLGWEVEDPDGMRAGGPTDVLGLYAKDYALTAQCGRDACEHSRELHIALLLKLFGPDITLAQVAARLRCSRCGMRGARMEARYRGPTGDGR
jgi:hypothetical protein